MAVFESSSTIHRLLQYKAAGARPAGSVEVDDEEELEGRYNFCRANPLETDAVLVDEAAMLDIQLAAALLEALHHKTQLILVGESSHACCSVEGTAMPSIPPFPLLEEVGG